MWRPIPPYQYLVGGESILLQILTLVSVPRRSHEDARLPHLAVAWQVVGSLKTVSHESIPSIC